MSTESDGREPDKTSPPEEGGMFAADPVWDRDRRRRRAADDGRAADESRAARAAAEPRSFAGEGGYEEPLSLDQPVSPEEARSATGESLVRPVPHASTDQEPRTDRLPVGAIVAAVTVAALVGAGAWYLLRDRGGVPELAPGASSMTTAPVAAAPPAPPTPAPLATPSQTAAYSVNPPPTQAKAATEPPRTTRIARTVTATRVRPAAPESTTEGVAEGATESSVDASAGAALPDGPQPYSSLNPGSAPAPVNPAAQPAPSTNPPTESIPVTPPTAPEAAPPSAAAAERPPQ